jgi:hypothetical protein
LKASKPILLLCCDAMTDEFTHTLSVPYPCPACRIPSGWHVTLSNTEGFSERACDECGYKLRLFWGYRKHQTVIKHFKVLGVRRES